MRRARTNALISGLWLGALALAVPCRAQSPDPCATTASVSPCFDADPWWIPTGRSAFAGIPSARALPRGELSLLLGGTLSTEPVVLVTPSPHPDGQEIPVVEATSTLTLGARIGLGRGVDVGVVLPFVPYQTGAGTESVTSQQADPLDPVALRDPRLGFSATLLGRAPGAPFVLGTHLDVAVPLGQEQALSGSKGLTVAPGFTGELSHGRLVAALDLGLRLTPAVSFGTVREGSSALVALGVSVAALTEPLLAFGLEAVLRPGLASPPPGAPEDTLDLPAEWLMSARFEPTPKWSLLLGGGSGLPLSRTGGAEGKSESVLAVTSPSFRGILTARYTLPSVY